MSEPIRLYNNDGQRKTVYANSQAILLQQQGWIRLKPGEEPPAQADAADSVALVAADVAEEVADDAVANATPTGDKTEYSPPDTPKQPDPDNPVIVDLDAKAAAHGKATGKVKK